jgi:hypothetical protein
VLFRTGGSRIALTCDVIPLNQSFKRITTGAAIGVRQRKRDAKISRSCSRGME